MAWKICHGWMWIFESRIHVCHHDQVFYSLVLSWVLLYVSQRVGRPGVSIKSFQFFFTLLIHLASLLCYFCSHIFLQNYVISFASGYLFIFVLFPNILGGFPFVIFEGFVLLVLLHSVLVFFEKFEILCRLPSLTWNTSKKVADYIGRNVMKTIVPIF